MGNFEIECPLGIILCPFQYTVYDCRAEWEWREENSCDGGRPVKVRRRICVDCKGDVVDEVRNFLNYFPVISTSKVLVVVLFYQNKD